MINIRLNVVQLFPHNLQIHAFATLILSSEQTNLEYLEILSIFERYLHFPNTRSMTSFLSIPGTNEKTKMKIFRSAVDEVVKVCELDEGVTYACKVTFVQGEVTIL
jgi:hypothetical protein